MVTPEERADLLVAEFGDLLPRKHLTAFVTASRTLARDAYRAGQKAAVNEIRSQPRAEQIGKNDGD